MALLEDVKLSLPVVEAIKAEGAAGALSKEALGQVNAALEETATAPNTLKLKLDQLSKEQTKKLHEFLKDFLNLSGSEIGELALNGDLKSKK